MQIRQVFTIPETVENSTAVRTQEKVKDVIEVT